MKGAIRPRDNVYFHRHLIHLQSEQLAVQKTIRRVCLGLGILLLLWLGLYVCVISYGLSGGPADMSFNEWMETEEAQQKYGQEQE